MSSQHRERAPTVSVCLYVRMYVCLFVCPFASGEQLIKSALASFTSNRIEHSLVASVAFSETAS